jgi:hypothetical protein
MGVVLWRYQRVDTPEPLLALVLLAAWLGVFSLACLAVGGSLWRWLSGAWAVGWSALPVVLAWGAAGLIAAAAGASVAGVLRPAVVTALLLVLAGLGGFLARLVLPPLLGVPHHARLPVALLVLAWTASLLAVPTASPFYDQLHYHLAFPFQWLHAGHLVTFARQGYSYLPANMGLLYVYPLASLGPWAAQAIHWWMGAVAAGCAGVLAWRAAGPRAAWWAAAVLAATPAVLLSSTWAAADLGVAAFGGACLLMVTVPDAGVRRPAWWVLAGALAGVAAGCKVLALATVAVPAFLALLAVCRRRVRTAALWVAGAAIAFAPWMARNWSATGNPVYPFLAGVFATADASVAPADLGDRIARTSASLPDPERFLTLGTFAPAGDAGSIGPVYLALLPLAAWAALRPRRRAEALLGVAALGGLAGWGAGPLLGRYLVPVLVPLAALAAAGWRRVVAAAGPLRPWLQALLAGALAWSILGGLSPIELTRVACTLGRESGSDLLRRYATYWPAVAFVNRELPPDARLLLVGESRCFGIERSVVVEDPFHTPLLAELAEASRTGSEIGVRLHAMGITHVLFNTQEAQRIASLNRRAEYFAPLSPVARARLAAFFAGCLGRVTVEGPVEVFVLKGCR